MSAPPTDLIDPWRACRRGMDFSGEATLRQLPRLAEAVLGLGSGPQCAGHGVQSAARQGDPTAGAVTDAGGPAESKGEGAAGYSLRFERDAHNRSTVIGRVHALLRLQCQRCLDEVEIPVDLPIALALIRKDEDALDLPDALDPLLVTDDAVRPLDIVEDELLLAIPTFPNHDWACGESARSDAEPRNQAATQITEGTQDASRQPFAVLAALKARDRH